MAAANEIRTPVFDWNAGDFLRDLSGNIVIATGNAAVEQIVIKALHTARSKYAIYLDPGDLDYHDKYGSEVQDIATRRELSEDVRISELKRAVREALIYDPWIRDVQDVVVERQGTDEAVASFKVITIFDTEVVMQGVIITNG